MNEILYIVVPCYNEEAVLPETSRRLREKLETLAAMGKISPQSRGAVRQRRLKGQDLGDHPCPA